MSRNVLVKWSEIEHKEGGDHHKEKSLEISSKSPPFLLQ